MLYETFLLSVLLLQKGFCVETLKPFWEYRTVAHAGGALFDDNGKMVTYTNSKEAVELNYEKGHRVFEIDFSLSQDNCLVALHGWNNKKVLTVEEWKKQKVFGKYTTMNIDDVIEILNDKKDIYLITDTKELDKKRIQVEFNGLYDSAKKINSDVLRRIVPQIYFPEMYEIIQSIYKFQNVIYTLYQSPQSDSNVIKFVRKHDEIKVITMWPWRATEQFVADLMSLGKLVYVHTMNDMDNVIRLFVKGVHGVYTDRLSVQQLQEWFQGNVGSLKIEGLKTMRNRCMLTKNRRQRKERKKKKNF